MNHTKFNLAQIVSQERSLLPISIICPHCKQIGTFESFNKPCDIKTSEAYIFGLRCCPNEECQGYLFFIGHRDKAYGKVHLDYTYPTLTIPFDVSNIPLRIVKAFEEALICHSNKCYVASAIMIRKTLEEICKEKEAKGNSLNKRLEDLSNNIVLPNELKEGMQELRLLGNDAAHVDANTFDEVGKDEVEVSLEFTKEILKGVYQYESLLNKIKALKKESDS